jgi:hypothetical protein
VRITVAHSAGECKVTARWLVGCDGMHSVVREQSGIRFLGSEYQESFVLADVRMNWPLSREEVGLFFSPDGLVVVVPLPDDSFRVVATIDVAPETPNAEFVRSMLDARGPRSAPAASATCCVVRDCGGASEVLCTAPQRRRRRDQSASAGQPQEATGERTYGVKEWRCRMATQAGQDVFSLRKLIERINANLKNHGFGFIPVRGLMKAKSVALWHALANNLMVAHRLRKKLA